MRLSNILISLLFKYSVKMFINVVIMLVKNKLFFNNVNVSRKIEYTNTLYIYCQKYYNQ